MNQEWFDMMDLRRRFFEKAAWIPLRAIKKVTERGQFGYAGHKEEFFGAGSVIFPLQYKSEAEKLGWSEIGIGHDHCGYIEDGIYIPSNLYSDDEGKLIGEHLVLEQRGNQLEHREWHINQDFVITLGLKREGDSWVSPDEGYIEVVRLLRTSDGLPILVEVRATYLKDYLCARKMALYITSYHQRVEVSETRADIKWSNDQVSDVTDTDRWEGHISQIHEGGAPYGESAAIFSVSRTDVDFEEDVPVFNFPDDSVLKSESWTKNFSGKKLFRIEGELWRSEWVNPGSYSPIIRRDKMPPTVFFITDSEGTQESKDTLVKGGRWLWFRPEVICDVAHRRGGVLNWYTCDTGEAGCLPDGAVHFGINKIGLINVYAKDIGMLPEWQQKIWAAYNTSPDGKVSEELLSSQMLCVPADTVAPEEYLAKGLKLIRDISKMKLDIEIFRNHDMIPGIIKRCHRFRSTDGNGLYALAKDVARLTADCIDATAIQTKVLPPKGVKWGSLKSLENLLATKVGPDEARRLTSSLVGVYELRHGDAHLPSGEIQKAFELLGINGEEPYVHQGYQLLNSCVISIFGIAKVLEKWDEK